MTSITIDNIIRSYCLLATHISVLYVISSPVVNFTCDKRHGAAISPGSVLDIGCIQPHLPDAPKSAWRARREMGGVLEGSKIE